MNGHEGNLSTGFVEHKIRDFERFVTLEPYRSRLAAVGLDSTVLIARLKELLTHRETSQYRLLEYMIHDMNGFFSTSQGFLSEGREVPESTWAKLGDLKQAIEFTNTTSLDQWSIPNLITWSADNGVTFDQGTRNALAHFSRSPRK